MQRLWASCYCWSPALAGVPAAVGSLLPLAPAYANHGILVNFLTVANVPAVASDHSVVVVPILAVFRTKKSNYPTIGTRIIGPCTDSGNYQIDYRREPS